MALVRMKPPVGVSVGLGADDKLYYIDGQGFANVDSGSATKLTAEGWVSAVPVAPEAPGNTFPVSASKTLTGGGIDVYSGTEKIIDGTIYTWATRPSAAANPGVTIRISDVGATTSGSHWVSDGTYWRPVNGQVVLQKQSGSIASTLAAVTGVASSMLVPSRSIIIPAGMLIPGDAQIKVEAGFRRTGANATATLNAHLGTNKTSGDNTIYAFTFGATNLLDILIAPTVDIAEATRFTSSNWQIAGGSGNGSVFTDKTTAFNVATEMGITFSISGANVADSFALIWYKVTLCQ